MGVRALIIFVTMSRVASTRPPGVRNVKTTSAAFSASARAMVSIMNCADTGWMMLSTSAEYTTCAFATTGDIARNNAIRMITDSVYRVTLWLRRNSDRGRAHGPGPLWHLLHPLFEGRP